MLDVRPQLRSNASERKKIGAYKKSVLRSFTSSKLRFLFYFYAGMVWFCRTESVRIRGHGRPKEASKPDYRLLLRGANATGGLRSPRSPK